MSFPQEGFQIRISEPVQVTSTKAVVSLVLGVCSFLVCLTGIPAAILGFLALGDISRRPREVGGKGMAIGGIVTGIVGTGMFCAIVLLLPAVSRVRDAALRTASSNQMKMIVLASHSFESRERQLPQDLKSPDGTPLLSWRVRILPYLDEGQLYSQFKLDESWDSPHNRSLIAKMPQVFECLSARPEKGKGITHYLAPRGKETLHGGVLNGRPVDGFSLGSIPDGSGNTVFVLEVDPDQGVPWTKPADWEVDLKQPRRGLGKLRSGGFQAGFCDGSVRMIDAKVSDEEVASFYTTNGREWGQTR